LKALAAVGEGDWKLLTTLSGPQVAGTADRTEETTQSVQSADLAAFEHTTPRRMPETTNLSAKEPRRLAAMQARLEKLYRSRRPRTAAPSSAPSG
jgi:hypothetical protein